MIHLVSMASLPRFEYDEPYIPTYFLSRKAEQKTKAKISKMNNYAFEPIRVSVESREMRLKEEKSS